MILSLALLPTFLASANLPAVEAPTGVQQQYQRWEQRLRDRIAERNLLSATALKNPACKVVVGFTVGPDQRPDDIEVVKSTCDSFYDRKAQRLVRQLGRVGRVPSASGENYRVMLNLTYGEALDPAADRRLTAALESERRFHSRRNLDVVTTANRLGAAAHRGGE